MSVWRLCSVLLLTPCVCTDMEVTFVRTVEREDVTPICTNETQSIITLIVCQISTERSRGELCRLTYRYMEGFQHDCDSRFTLMMEKQTAFLHLMDLTAEDSGNYSCECSLPGGTNITHVTLTVTGQEVALSLLDILLKVVLPSGVTLMILIFILLVKYCCKKSGGSMQDCPDPLDDDDDSYMSLQEPTNDIYQTMPANPSQSDTWSDSNSSNHQSCYENIEIEYQTTVL